MRKYYIFIILLTVFVVAILINGFSLMGSPLTQRERVLDQIRLANFSLLSNKIEDYYRLNYVLPQRLEFVSGIETYKDPQAHIPYEYQVIDAANYKFCAFFSTDESTQNDPSEYRQNSKKHKKGYDCIEYSLPLHLTSSVSREISATGSCPVELQNGDCVLSNCTYSYPNDIFTKGSIVVGGKYPTHPSGIYHDECTSDKKSVVEMFCSRTDGGDYVDSRASFNCPNGCEDGMCLRY